MQVYIKKAAAIAVLILIILNTEVKAQSENLKDDEHFKEHLSLKDTFFGSEKDYMICYPKSHQTFFVTIFSLGFITLLSLSYVFIIQRKFNKKLLNVNKIIEEKNSDLISSINYSLRIQKAILPEIPLSLNKNNFLVYYQPKDIVSGDTYWVEETESKLIFIIADCTGHGISGALLTMLVNTAIRKSLYDSLDLNPSTLLDTINTELKNSLKQNNNPNLSDSADMAIVTLNKATNELQFAGANCNLYLITNNKLELIKGSKCTVGSVQEHVTESPTTISKLITKNDGFVLYSDGIIDQIGGDKNNKLKRSGLQNIIEKNISTNFIATLEQGIDAWKHNNEQVDDMTLLAFKLTI